MKCDPHSHHVASCSAVCHFSQHSQSRVAKDELNHQYFQLRPGGIDVETFEFIAFLASVNPV